MREGIVGEALTRWLSRERLEVLLAQARTCRVGVVGDLALDGYWVADMTRARLSRETPHFPRPVVAERYAPGAGANVAQNLSALGVARTEALSVIGDDWRGGLLTQALRAQGVDVGRMLVSSQRGTTAYIKPLLTGYESQQEDARLDFENAEPPAAEVEDELIARVAGALDELDALFVADQFEIHGVVSERVREALIGLAREHRDKVFVADSRCRIGWFRGMVVKPNRAEAAAALSPGGTLGGRGEAEALSRLTEGPVVLTLSGEGALVWDEGTVAHVPAAPVAPPLDPVGAGDAFGAALTVALACGASLPEAAAMANLAAAVTVEKLGQTGTATPDEIVARYEMAASGDSGATL
jgi:rfaE bifunctional protein kinase chain/domain